MVPEESELVTTTPKPRTSVRKRANAIKPFLCKNLIAVLENPSDIVNIGTVIRT
jgi:tRNA (guanosine-2'-O-)-methyltransferase